MTSRHGIKIERNEFYDVIIDTMIHDKYYNTGYSIDVNIFMLVIPTKFSNSF